MWDRYIRRGLRFAKRTLSILGPHYGIPEVGDVEDFLRLHVASRCGVAGTSTLDLGCGTNPRNPFGAETKRGVDIRCHDEESVKIADLVLEKIPFETSAFDYVTAFDFLEHVPRVAYIPSRRYPFVEIMNEVHRGVALILITRRPSRIVGVAAA